MIEMTDSDMELQHKVQVLLLDYVFNWPSTFNECLSIKLPDGCAWSHCERMGYFVTNFCSFFVEKNVVEMMYRVETKH